MVLLFFALDLRSLSPPLLSQLKQVANLYAISSPASRFKRRKVGSGVEDNIGLCYLQPSEISGCGELKIAYSPRGKGFSISVFHYAVNHLPSDSYSPLFLEDSRSTLFRDVDLSSILSNGLLDAAVDKDIERKIILISSSLVGNIDSNIRKSLQDAADRCVSVEFVLLEQQSSQLAEFSENITNFREQICELENCSFNAYLPDDQILNGLVKRWVRELKGNSEELLHAHFAFQKSVAGSIDKISCKLCYSINQIMAGYSPCKGLENTIQNSMKVGEHTMLSEAYWTRWRNLSPVSAVHFNVVERTSLVSLSDGVVVGRPYIVIPSVDQETDSSPDESEMCQLNSRLFQGLCRALYLLNQGLVCWSFCNIETMKETAFHYFYILQPSDSGLMLLRRLAVAEEILPFPDVNLSEMSADDEIENSIQQWLEEVELRDYNPVQHVGGFHQKFNELIEECLQSGVEPQEYLTTALHSTCLDVLPASQGGDTEPLAGGTSLLYRAHSNDKGVALTQEWEQLTVDCIPKEDSVPSEPNLDKCLVQEWEQLIIDAKPRMDLSEPILEKSTTPLPSSHRPVDRRTSKILERLGNPRQSKMKPIILSDNATDAEGMTGKHLHENFNAADHGHTTTNNLMRPTFHKLKRKHR